MKDETRNVSSFTFQDFAFFLKQMKVSLVFLHQLDDGLGHPGRVGNLLEDKPRLLGGSLDVDRAEVEEGWQDALELGGDILDPEQLLLGGFPGEQTFLFNIDDSPVGNDPGVEVVVNEAVEDKDPDVEVEDAQKQQEDSLEDFIGERLAEYLRIEEVKRHWQAADDYPHEQLEAEHQPVAAQQHNDFFVFGGVGEVIFSHNVTGAWLARVQWIAASQLD